MAIMTSQGQQDDKVNWDGLCKYVSSKNSNSPCSILPDRFEGGCHLIKLLDLGDTQWIARINRGPSTQSTASYLRSEIDTMELIRARTKIPTPKIFGYELEDTNIVGASFMLMEYLPGTSGMDAEGDFDVHRGQIPFARRDSFYREIAGIQVQLSSIRMPKIGSIIRRDDNEFDVGPLPGLGGPFSTATEFFKAWAREVKFPKSDSSIRRYMNNGPVDDVLRSIRHFPDTMTKLASSLSKYDNGPFPLYHPDFYQSNVIVDENFDVLGIIDWEGASTVPWEFVQFPLFLTALPAAMDDPNNYDENGCPKDDDAKSRLSERSAYAELVQKKELELNVDQKLSNVLRNPDIQGLAYAVKVYHDPGKMGFYCETLKPFDTLH